MVSRHFGDNDAPSTLLGMAVLGHREQLVEVEAIAVLPEGSFVGAFVGRDVQML